ncbi:MAG: GumC family protein [Pirellulales bacterium]
MSTDMKLLGSHEPADALDVRSDQSASHMVHAAMHFLRVAQLHRQVMIVAFVVMGLLGGLYFATATRLYQAEASLLIISTGGNMLSTSMTAEGAKQEIIPTYCQLLKSAIVLEAAIRSLPRQHRIDFQTEPREKWVEILEENLSATAVRRTNIIDVRYESRDPEAAVAVVNAVLQAYFDFIDRTHKGTASQIIEVLGREKVELEQRLTERQDALLEAQRSFGDLGIEAGGPIVHPLVQRAVRINEALIEALEQRLKAQSTLTAVEESVRNGENLQQHLLAIEGAVGREILLASLGLNPQDAAVQSDLEQKLLADRAELASLAQAYGPAHPKYVALTDRIRSTQAYLQSYRGRLQERLVNLRDRQLGPMLVQMLTQAVNKAWQHETSLRESFEQARQEAVRLNGGLAKLKILEHDVGRLRGLHDVLVNQIANTDLSQEHGDIRAAVVQHPTASPRPVSPQLSIVVLVCLFGSVIVGGATIYVLDTLDDRFRSPDELRIRLGVPVLAMVRQLEASQQSGMAGVQVHAASESVAAEAFRTLRTALALSPHETERIVLSSSEPGDGKTTVLVNLAVSFAQSGKRTLIIDADLRRPGLTSLLGLKGTQGVSDVLRSDGDVAGIVPGVVQATEVPGLDVLASGPRRPNPAEMLAGPQFPELLAWADAHYDQILVDSPPVLAASDAQIIGRLVDGVILVMHAESSRRRVVARAVESFTSLSIEVLGVVANRVNPDRGVGYGYGYGYGYQYGESDETSASDTSDSESARTGGCDNRPPSEPSWDPDRPEDTKRVA